MSVEPSRRLKCSTAPLVGLALALILAVLLSSCGGAGGRLLISDQSGTLDRAQIESAAAPLVARGAVVGVFIVAHSAEPVADVHWQLGAVGLLEDGATAPDVIALYVSLDPRYSELRAGSRWSGTLPDATLREIRLATLNPALHDGSFTVGAAGTLGALEAHLGRAAIGERIKTWLSYAVLAVLLLVVIWFSPLGEQLGRLWSSSPPGKLSQWLWDQTPAGQAKLQRILRTAQLRLENRVEYARSWCRAVSSARAQPGGESVGERLKDLDRARAQIQQTLRGRALLTELERLAWAYEALGRDAERLTPRRPPKKPRAGAAYHAPAGTWDTTPAQSDTASSDSSTSWDSSVDTGSQGPSSDGGSW